MKHDCDCRSYPCAHDWAEYNRKMADEWEKMADLDEARGKYTRRVIQATTVERLHSIISSFPYRRTVVITQVSDRLWEAVLFIRGRMDW